MDYRIQNVKYKVSNIKKNLRYKDNIMNRFEYRFADSLFNNLKNSLNSETDDDFKELFYAYSGKSCENKLLYSTILEFNFYKDNVDLSSNFHSNVVTNELKERLIESNINVSDLSYYYNEALFYELNENRENSNDKDDVIVKVSVSCVLQFNYLSFPELLAHRILKSNLVQSLCGIFR